MKNETFTPDEKLNATFFHVFSKPFEIQTFFLKNTQQSKYSIEVMG